MGQGCTAERAGMHLQVCYCNFGKNRCREETQHVFDCNCTSMVGKPAAACGVDGRPSKPSKPSATLSLLRTPLPKTTPAYLHQKKGTTASLTEQSSPQPCMGAQRGWTSLHP